jgi:hypothetical protein
VPGIPFGFSAVTNSLDGYAVALSIGMDANTFSFCGIPNRQLAGSLQHELRPPGKLRILAAARRPRNLTPNPRLGRSSFFWNGMFSTPAAKQKRKTLPASLESRLQSYPQLSD